VAASVPSCRLFFFSSRITFASLGCLGKEFFATIMPQADPLASGKVTKPRRLKAMAAQEIHKKEEKKLLFFTPTSFLPRSLTTNSKSTCCELNHYKLQDSGFPNPFCDFSRLFVAINFLSFSSYFLDTLFQGLVISSLAFFSLKVS
jgi:hypothetical protein